MYQDDFLKAKLEKRQNEHAFRQLRLPEGKIDFCSNDYLGIVKNQSLQISADGLAFGSTGSRLLAGNYQLIEKVEQTLAQFHQADAALIYNSGYDANIGLLSCVPQRGDTILYDYLCHASIRDGIRLSFAQAHAFAHNDMIDLEQQLQQAKGTVFIVTESVFSMDGDTCPLQAIITLAKKYQGHVIIDEAHATGVIGQKGEGLVQDLEVQQSVFARVHTFGKAVGCHGAVVLGSQQLRDYLINFSRSLMYSTALPPHAVAVIQQRYQLFPTMDGARKHIQYLVHVFQAAILPFEKLASTTPIQVVIIPGNEAARSVAAHLQANNFDVRAILYPTVPKGSERLRIVLHAFNTVEEVNGLIAALQAASKFA
jgi:8-amino-7-oxononanoate synthase